MKYQIKYGLKKKEVLCNLPLQAILLTSLPYLQLGKLARFQPWNANELEREQRTSPVMLPLLMPERHEPSYHPLSSTHIRIARYTALHHTNACHRNPVVIPNSHFSSPLPIGTPRRTSSAAPQHIKRQKKAG